MNITVEKSTKIKLELVTKPDDTLPGNCFDNVIGQENVIKKLKFYLATHKIGSIFPSMLFTGSHGLGKTYVAGIMASNLGRRFLEVNCGTLGTTKDFVEEILLNKIMGMEPVTVLFDEAHRFPNEISTLLLTLLSPSFKGINILEYHGCEICYDLTKINTVLATTDSFKILSPLVNRCEMIYFKSYTNKELIQMLKFYLPGIEFTKFTDRDFEDLAYACRGRGRDTYQLAQKIKRYCQIDDKRNFSVSDWEGIKDVFGIYPMGLNAQEVNLLRIIRVDGVISCANIAARMMVGEENVSEEIEIRPKELWLISNTPRGRVLTNGGEEYFDTFLNENKKKTETILKPG